MWRTAKFLLNEEPQVALPLTEKYVHEFLLLKAQFSKVYYSSPCPFPCQLQRVTSYYLLFSQEIFQYHVEPLVSH